MAEDEKCVLVQASNGGAYVIPKWHIEAGSAAAIAGVPCINIIGCGAGAQILPERVCTIRKQYLDECVQNNEAVLKWETLMEIIRSGNLVGFKQKVEQMPEIASAIGCRTSGTSPVHAAAFYPAAIKILRYLLTKRTVDPNVVSASGTNALAYAANAANLAAVKMLLKCPRCNKTPIGPLFPPIYLPNVEVRDNALQALAEIYALLPETHPLWDKRWPLCFDMCCHAAKVPTALPTIDATISLEANPPQKKQCTVVKPVTEEDRVGHVDLCQFCMAVPPSTIVLPCHHCVLCSACSLIMKQTPNKDRCIVCSAQIECIYDKDSDTMEKIEPSA